MVKIEVNDWLKVPTLTEYKVGFLVGFRIFCRLEIYILSRFLSEALLILIENFTVKTQCFKS